MNMRLEEGSSADALKQQLIMQSLNVNGMLTDQELPFSGQGSQKMLNVSSGERLPLEDVYLA